MPPVPPAQPDDTHASREPDEAPICMTDTVPVGPLPRRSDIGEEALEPFGVLIHHLGRARGKSQQRFSTSPQYDREALCDRDRFERRHALLHSQLTEHGIGEQREQDWEAASEMRV